MPREILEVEAHSFEVTDCEISASQKSKHLLELKIGALGNRLPVNEVTDGDQLELSVDRGTALPGCKRLLPTGAQARVSGSIGEPRETVYRAEQRKSTAGYAVTTSECPIHESTSKMKGTQQRECVWILYAPVAPQSACIFGTILRKSVIEVKRIRLPRN